MRYVSSLLILLAGTIPLLACESTSYAPPIAITPQPIQTCIPVSALTRVDIPAQTQVYYAITQIENPPYDPIERKEKITRVIKEAETIFVDSEGQKITDICNPEIDPESAPETR